MAMENERQQIAQALRAVRHNCEYDFSSRNILIYLEDEMMAAPDSGKFMLLVHEWSRIMLRVSK